MRRWVYRGVQRNSHDKGIFAREIPVQIKGTTSKVAGRDGVKRKVDIVDLEKYLDVYAGVLYFVVFMDSKLSLKEIYYKQYLPFDIRKALKERKHAGQKTITDKFRPLPKDPSSFKGFA